MMRRARPLLGTIVEITAEGADDVLCEAFEAAFAAIECVHRLMSFHDPQSDVSRINGADALCAVSVNPHTCRVLAFAHELSEISTGAFDVTMAPVLAERGFLPRIAPSRVAPETTYRDLDLLPGDRVRWRREGCLDLGGVAKGYAVDCAIAALKSHGAETAVVNAGGDLRCFGEAQPIHLRHPNAPMLLMHLGWLADAALATSAGYFSETADDDRQVHPLVDPRRRRCENWNGSVSVAASDCMIADALTKIVRLKPDTAPSILEGFDAQAIVADPHGTRSCGRSWLREDAAT